MGQMDTVPIHKGAHPRETKMIYLDDASTDWRFDGFSGNIDVSRSRADAMTHYTHLWLFFVLVFSVVVQPGMDMAYVLGSALTGGMRSGFMAIAGIITGAACHTVMGALGIGVLLKLFPAAFDCMLLAGTAYLVWIGWSMIRSARAFDLRPKEQPRLPLATYRRGAITNLLNPKAYLFTLAVFPQFLRPEYGSLALQALLLWLIAASTEVGVYGTLVVAAHEVRAWLASNPSSGIVVGRAVGMVLIALAIFNAVQGWQRA
jgi:threonine/homoserine/homoserine lactone efflux protein